MQRCHSELQESAQCTGTSYSQATFEVKLQRANDELWGFAWSYNGISARRLIISGVNSRSPAGRLTRCKCGDELLSVNGSKGLEGMRRELYEALEVTLIFRNAADSPPPPARRSMALASNARTRAVSLQQQGSVGKRPAPIAPPSIKARVKNSFIHFSDSEEAGETSDDGLFSTSDPLPISRLGKPLNFRSPYMSGCLAGLDLPRVAAVCDSARSEDDWASARSSSEDGNTSGDHSNKSIPSCPSTDWDFPTYQALAVPVPMVVAAPALPNPQHLNHMALGRLMMLPCPVGGVALGGNAINSGYAAEVPVPVSVVSHSFDTGHHESETNAHSGMQAETCNNPDGSRPLAHSEPSDISEAGSSEAGPPPQTMSKLWEDEGWLKPDDPQSSMDESTTYASTLSGPQKKVRRGGKRMHRPCHQRAKQDSEGQKVSPPCNPVDASGHGQNSSTFEGRSFYPLPRKQKLQQADIGSTAACTGEETQPPEGERVSVATAPTTQSCEQQQAVETPAPTEKIPVDVSPPKKAVDGSKCAVPDVRLSTEPKRKASATRSAARLGSATQSNRQARDPDLQGSSCAEPALQQCGTEKRRVPRSRSAGSAVAKPRLDNLSTNANVDVPKCLPPESQSCAAPKQKASPTKSSVRRAAKAPTDTLSSQASADLFACTAPDVQLSPAPKRKTRGRMDPTSHETDKVGSKNVVPEVELAPEPKRKVSSARGSAGRAAKSQLDVSVNEADISLSNSSAPDVQQLKLPKRKTARAKSSSRLASKGRLDTPLPEAEEAVSKSDVCAAQPSPLSQGDASAGTNRWQRHRVSLGAQPSSGPSEKVPATGRKSGGSSVIASTPEPGHVETAARGGGVSATKWRPTLRL